MSLYSYCMFMYLNRASWHSSATLTEVFPCFFFGCKANAMVKPAKMGHGPHSSYFCVVLCIVYFCVVLCIVYFCVVLCICFMSFCVLFVCKCVLYYCHRVATQLQLRNISTSSYSPIRSKSTESTLCICVCACVRARASVSKANVSSLHGAISFRWE
jgi:hypothetical protein